MDSTAIPGLSQLMERYAQMLSAFQGSAASAQPDWSALAAQFARELERGFVQGALWWNPLVAASSSPAGASLAGEAGPARLLQPIGRLLQHHSELARCWSMAAQQAAQDFAQRMGSRAGEPALTAVATLELWLECAERAYTAVVSTDAFCAAQAGAVNATLELFGATRPQWEALAEGLGLVTRKQFEALEREVRRRADPGTAPAGSQPRASMPRGRRTAPGKRAERAKRAPPKRAARSKVRSRRVRR
ncbi:MAG TPA: poly(R)-hydroxyalkanoic acid synthase subunit PhaE [Steroidobacteraceae bacterium]|nr:poly(R)-hydroxyalkanoic acid synthase subunit PhaE [Steroidobacteraceae bacterium]